MSVFTETMVDAFNNAGETVTEAVAKAVEGAPTGLFILANGLSGLCSFTVAAASFLSAGATGVANLASVMRNQLEPYTEKRKLRC